MRRRSIETMEAGYAQLRATEWLLVIKNAREATVEALEAQQMKLILESFRTQSRTFSVDAVTGKATKSARVETSSVPTDTRRDIGALVSLD